MSASRLVDAFTKPSTGLSDWRRWAVCGSADPELFWPAKGEQADPALRLCERCPMLGDCREFFFSQGKDDGGVWFATTYNERRTLRKRRLQGYS